MVCGAWAEGRQQVCALKTLVFHTEAIRGTPEESMCCAHVRGRAMAPGEALHAFVSLRETGRLFGKLDDLTSSERFLPSLLLDGRTCSTPLGEQPLRGKLES